MSEKEETFIVVLEVPTRLKSRYPIRVTIQTKDPQELLMTAHINLAYMEKRYGVKPSVLFDVGDTGDM